MTPPHQATLMQKYFYTLSRKIERARPSPGPACVGYQQIQHAKTVQRSDRKIVVTSTAESTPGPFLYHKSLSGSGSAALAKSDRWNDVQTRKPLPGPNKYQVDTKFESKYRSCQSPEMNTSERFKVRRAEKRPDYYFDASYQAVLPDMKATRINRSQRCTDAWLM